VRVRNERWWKRWWGGGRSPGSFRGSRRAAPKQCEKNLIFFSKPTGWKIFIFERSEAPVSGRSRELVATDSGEGARPACWRRRFAFANFSWRFAISEY